MASSAQTDASISRIARIGLGCSRLGSIGAQDSTPPEKLLQTAAEAGITFYDTADIYAQGDSERHIGKFLRSSSGNLVICTKVGQYFPWYFKPAFLVKGLIKALLRLGGRRIGSPYGSRANTAAGFFGRLYRTEIPGEPRAAADRFGQHPPFAQPIGGCPETERRHLYASRDQAARRGQEDRCGLR
ncbi:hypothetical protein ABH999_003634 [Bradyrhizobium yuanmingense]